MSSEENRDQSESVDRSGRLRLASTAAIACVPLLLMATGPQLFRGESIAEWFSVVDIYYPSALKVRAGAIPYRDFPLEYPLLSLPAVVLPIAFGTDKRTYGLAFAVETMLINAALIVLVAAEVERTSGRSRLAGRLVWYCLFFTALSRMIVSRIDLGPTLMAFWSTSLWYRRKSVAGGILAGLGTLMKIFPGFVTLTAVSWEASQEVGRNFRGALAFAATIAIGLTIWMAIGGRGAIASLTYHGERGLELESFYAGILMAVGQLWGWKYKVPFDHGSYNLVGPWTAGMVKVSGVLMALAVVVTLLRFALTGYRTPMRFTLAILIATIMTAKVLSPQYFIWLLPFVVTLDDYDGRSARPLYAGICLLTLVNYPGMFEPLTHLEPGAIVLLNLRNALAVALWGVLTFGGGRPASATAPELNPGS